MFTGLLIFGGIMVALGVGSHVTGMPHLFYILFLPIAKILAIGIFIGICLYAFLSGHFPS